MVGKIEDTRHHHTLVLGMVAQLAVASKHSVVLVLGVFQHSSVSDGQISFASELAVEVKKVHRLFIVKRIHL